MNRSPLRRMRVWNRSEGCLKNTGSRLGMALAVIALAPAAHGDDWPCYRGPNANGVSNETGWKADAPKVLWKKNVGIGASSVVVSGNRVVTMGNVDNQDVVSCLNADDGKELWRYSYPCRFDGRSFDGGTASTPTIDGQLVYTMSYDGQLYCINLTTGKEVWKKNVVKDFGGSFPGWKYAGSPLVLDKLLVLDIGGNGNSTIALNKMTGAKVWGAGSDGAGYATPQAVALPNGFALLVFKGKALVGLNAASGAELFRIPWVTSYDVNASTPIALGDKFFVSSGYPDGRGALFALNRGKPQQLWLNDQIKTKMSSCVPVGGSVYCVNSEAGLLVCADMKDGRTAWTQGRFGHGTLIAAGGKLIVLSEDGELTIAEASPKAFQAHSRTRVLNGRCWVTPSMANGRIYCRTNRGDLACVDVR